MPEFDQVTFYLTAQLRRRAEAGNHRFLAMLTDVVVAAGLRPVFADRKAGYDLAAAVRPGYGVFLMDEPTNDRIVTIRHSYFGPFWRIEGSARRWDWPVAQTAFDPDSVDTQAAQRFITWWGKNLFGDGPDTATRGDYVYVPLQGRLTEHRSFQSCSPIRMLETILEHEPRRIMATLHPREDYSNADHAILNDFCQRFPRLSIETGNMAAHLRECDYVVTQNSGVGLLGYFHRKPLILFGKIDFHHIALNVADIGAADAFAQVRTIAPDYAGYMWWFQRIMAIDAAGPDAVVQVAARLRHLGWPV